MTDFTLTFLITLAVVEVLFWGFTVGMLRKIWNKLKG